MANDFGSNITVGLVTSQQQQKREKHKATSEVHSSNLGKIDDPKKYFLLAQCAVALGSMQFRIDG